MKLPYPALWLAAALASVLFGLEVFDADRIAPELILGWLLCLGMLGLAAVTTGRLRRGAELRLERPGAAASAAWSAMPKSRGLPDALVGHGWTVATTRWGTTHRVTLLDRVVTPSTVHWVIPTRTCRGVIRSGYLSCRHGPRESGV